MFTVARGRGHIAQSIHCGASAASQLFTATGDGALSPGQLLPGAVISGFVPGDTIDLTGIAYDSSGSATLTRASRTCTARAS